MPGPFTPTPIEGLSPREKDDHYDTPPSCTEALLSVETFGENVWEPAVGRGYIANTLASHGHLVHASDIVDRGYTGVEVKDFLQYDHRLALSIVTNPPFKLADEFVLHAIKLEVEKIAIFQRTAWLEGARRYDTLWGPYRPARIWQFCKRQTLWRGDDPNPKQKGGTIAFAWFVWERSHSGAPLIGWLRQ